MDEYIKREDAIAILTKLEQEPLYQHSDEDFYNGIGTAITELNRLPAAEVAEVRHGRWEFWGPNSLNRDCMCGTCSACHVRSKYIVNTAICPNCGALMKENEHDG